MQRRAAAVSAAVFLLVAAGSFALIGAAQQPDIEVEGAYTLSPGDEFTVGGTQYNLSTDSKPAEGSATIQWVNESARFTATLENGSTVTYRDGTYAVRIESAQDPSAFTLVEAQNTTEILQNDPEVYNEVYTGDDGTKYVRYRSDGSLEPLQEYLPEPETARFSEGATFPYQDRSTEVAAVTNESVTLAWRASEVRSASPGEGENVTLSDETFVAHFEENSLVLSKNFQAYQSEIDAREYFHERVNGLWGVTILSMLTAVLLVMFAYLPSRY